MFKFIKKYWILFLLSFAAILYITNFVLNFKKSPTTPPNPTPTTTNTATYKTLSPGSSSQEDVNKVLGSPVKEEKNNGTILAEYKSSNQYRYHTVEFENNTVSIIKEVINTPDNKNSESIISVYGVAPYILYDQYPGSTFNLYVYPQNGIAYLGHKNGTTLLEIWYFKPTSIDNFISKWGQGYGKEKPVGPPKGY